jgi:hypothetical protein
MALNADNVHVGPGRIFLGVTNPTTGIPPTWMPHTAGVPTPGTEVGYTTGDLNIRKVKETGEVQAEQAMYPIMTFMTSERVEVEFDALERVYASLQAAFDNTGTVNTGGRMGFFGGGSQYALRTQSVFVSSLRPNQVGMYEITVIYKAYVVGGYEIAYRKNAASTYRILLRGLMDTTRSIGDQAYQHYIETP